MPQNSNQVDPWEQPTTSGTDPWETSAPPSAPAPTAVPPSPTRALAKATTIKAQPKPFSKQWFKEAGFRGTAATAEALPAAGGMIGMELGGAAGAASGGVGAVPGAIAGGAFGGATGDAARQLLQRWLGYPSPTTSAEAARQIGMQGVLQGVLTAGGEGLNALLGRAAPAMQRGAEEQYYRALAPTQRGTKATAQQIVPELIQRGERGSLESLEERAAARAAAINPQLDVAYAQTPASATVLPTGPLGMGVGSGTQILSDLNTLKQRYIVRGKVINPQAVRIIGGVEDLIRDQGSDIDPLSLRAIRQDFDETLKAAGEYKKAGLPLDLPTRLTVKAQKTAADSIRRIMGQANPDIAALNKEMHFWLQVQEVTSETNLRRTGQSGGLVKTLAAPLGAAAGGAFGVGGATHSVEGGVLGAASGALSTLATQMVRSPAWGTTSAVFKNRVANALARGNIGDALVLAARIGIAAPAAIEKATQPLPGKDQTVTPTTQ